MKVLVIGPADRIHRTEHYILRGFVSAGHEVRHVSTSRLSWLPGRSADALLERFVKRFDPEYVLSTRARGVAPDTLARISHGRRAAMWYFDAPPQIPADVLEKARAIGTLFVTNRGHLPYYREQGVKRALFLPQACDARYHRSRPPRGGLRYRLSFIGKVGSEESRRAFLTEVGGREELHVWGRDNAPADAYTVHRRAVYNRTLTKVVGESLAVVGVNSFESMNHIEAYASNRVWLTLGCGGFYIGYRAPHIERVVSEEYCQYYQDTDELIERVSYYAAHPGERERIREAGYRWVHAHHTYRHRVENLLGFRELELGRLSPPSGRILRD
ncbi:MAG: glycosyltransferase [Chitinivibrionales bacterium]|nr:glycosyltransferase [Chitinivibrionales bacterium]